MTSKYTIEDIDEAARDLLQALSDLDLPVPLAIAACCRVITVIGTQEDLDTACKLIDDLQAIPFGTVEGDDGE